MNLRQRIFEAFPAPPATISLLDLMERFPYIEPTSIYGVVRSLVQSRHLEPYGRATYRRALGATMPEDERGGPRPNSGGARPGAGRPKRAA